ncbi:methyl-accepting chemotaxis protein, partial [Leptospira sp. 96542]|nr:methyl-accepting chemotaxis protein [Leptospira sp. 96542]
SPFGSFFDQATFAKKRKGVCNLNTSSSKKPFCFGSVSTKFPSRDSVGKVEQGSALADRAGSTISNVVQSIQRVSDIVSEITLASKEQSTGVAQATQAIAQMDGATQQNAALVEQMAAAAVSLRTQAQDMVRSVNVFKLAAVASPMPEPLRLT